MTAILDRPSHAWRAMEPERRLAAIAAVALLLTMFFPWYGLQSVDRKTGAIYSHNISAFGDVSFVEAAIFLVAAGVIAMLLARAEGRDFHLPGGDGTIVMIAGGWAALLIFYRVFDRPTGSGYPVGIEWGFFLAFVAAGSLAYAGWRMRISERPRPASRRPRPRRADPGDPDEPDADPDREPEPSIVLSTSARERRPVAVPARRERPSPEPTEATEPIASRGPSPAGEPRRGRYPPAPPEQLSFEDPPSQHR
jgi:hypothetical protein